MANKTERTYMRSVLYYTLSAVWSDGTREIVAADNVRPQMGILLDQEGLRVTQDDVQRWRQKRYEELLAKEVPNKRSGIISKQRREQLYGKTWQSPDRPKVNDFKPPQESPIFIAVKYRLKPFLSEGKADKLMHRMWAILTGAKKGKKSKPGKGSLEYFREIVAVFMTMDESLLPALGEALFSVSVYEAANHPEISIPTALLPLLYLCSKVDGRGELLATFWFSDLTWLPGTGKYDLVADDGTHWHVKELISTKIRMGGTNYPSSKLADELVELSKHLDWKGTNKKGKPLKTNPRYSLSKGLLDANEPLIIEKFGSMSAFYDRLNALLQESESHARGILFFKGDKVIVRLMKDVECVGATKGDLEVQPRGLSQPMKSQSTKVGLVPGSFKPYHAGHDAMIRLAAKENDKVTVFVSVTDRDNVSGKAMERIWKEHIEPSLPDNVTIVYGGSPVGNVYKVVGDANQADSTDAFTIYSDPIDAAQNYKSLDKYAGKLVANGQVKTRAIERSSTVDVSGTQMRQWLVAGDKSQFIKNLPQCIDSEAVWALLSSGVSTASCV